MKVEFNGQQVDIIDALKFSHANNLNLYRDAAIKEILALREALQARKPVPLKPTASI